MQLQILSALVLSIVGVVASAQSPLAPLPAEEFTLGHARHLLMRAGFGGTVEEAQRLHRLGLAGMVSWLVDYETRPDVVAPIAIAPPEPVDRQSYRRLPEAERRKLRERVRREDQKSFADLRRWWMDRLLRSRRPLEEKMTLLWHGHFTSSYREVRSARLLWMQNDLLRAHATGNFGVLLHEISKDPAMLRYLNNDQNRKGRPNENYAREVMELFTLGLGNYTEQDIKEAARAFTGWTFRGDSGRFVFDRRQHDTGRKTIFGKSGDHDGDDVCDLLLAHPACAPFVAGKIFGWFAYADPGPEVIRELAALFESSNYELKPLLRCIFTSRAFYSERARGTQVKSPVVLLVSTVRMLGMNPPPAAAILAAAQRLGQDLLMPPNVKGWEEGLAWITTASLLERNNLCAVLLRTVEPAAAAGRRPGPGRVPVARALAAWDPGFDATALVAVLEPASAAELVDRLAQRLLYVPLSRTTRDRLVAFVAGQDGSPPLDLGNARGPAADGKIRHLLHLLMSAPEFQVG